MTVLSDNKHDFGWKKSDDRRKAFAHCLALSGGDETEAQLLLDLIEYRASKLV